MPVRAERARVADLLNVVFVFQRLVHAMLVHLALHDVVVDVSLHDGRHERLDILHDPLHHSTHHLPPRCAVSLRQGPYAIVHLAIKARSVSPGF